MAKVRKFNGGGMKSNWEGSNQVSPGHPSQSYNPTKNPATKSHWSGNGGNGNGGKTKTVTTSSGGDNKPEKYKSKVKVTGPVTAVLWAADTALGPYTTAYNKKKRTKFARDEGLFRDYHIANRYNTDLKSRTLDVMSKRGKDFLKEAGYVPFQDKRETGEGKEHLKCPDGTAAPCPPQATSTPAVTPASTTPQSTWKLYPEGSDYITGQCYDTGGGVRKGPPPKRGPNPQVPPLLFSRGGGAAVKGTKFKGVK